MALLAASLADLRAEVNALDPGRDRTSDGWIGDPDHAARVSRHNPDAGGIVRALDIDRDGDEWDDLGNFIAEHLRARRDPRLNVVIWRRRLFSSYATTTRQAWTWGPYGGVNAHLAHVHVDVKDGLAGSRAGGWGLPVGRPVQGRPPITLPTTPTPAPAPEVDLDATERAALLKVAPDLAALMAEVRATRQQQAETRVDLAELTTLVRTAASGRAFDVIRTVPDGAIYVAGPGLFRQLTLEQWKLLRRAGYTEPTTDINYAERDRLRNDVYLKVIA